MIHVSRAAVNQSLLADLQIDDHTNGDRMPAPSLKEDLMLHPIDPAVENISRKDPKLFEPGGEIVVLLERRWCRPPTRRYPIRSRAGGQ